MDSPQPITFLSVFTTAYVITPTQTLTRSGTTTSTITLTSTSTLKSKTTSSTQLDTSQSDFTQSTSSLLTSTMPTTLSTNIVNTSSGSSTIGLAIGIPIAILSLFALVIGGWIFWKKKKFSKKRLQDLPFRDDSDNHLDRTLSNTNPYEKYSTRQPNNYPQRPPLSEHLEYRDGAKKLINVEKNFSRKSFLNRGNASLTQLASPVADPAETRGNLSYSRFSGFISPILLKKFNLMQSQEQSSPTESLERQRPTPPLPPLLKKPLPFPPVINTNKSYTPSSLRNMENAVLSNLHPIGDRFQSLEDQVYTVIRPYNKALNDELTIALGDKVNIVKSHSDGWCYIRKEDGTEGMIPKLCLKYKSSSKT